MEDFQDIASRAIGTISGANMAGKQELLCAAKELEELSETNYYDDSDGCKLLADIAKYFRSKL